MIIQNGSLPNVSIEYDECAPRQKKKRMSRRNNKTTSKTTLEDPLTASVPVLKGAIRTYKRNTCRKDVSNKSQSTSAMLPIQPDSK